MGMMVSFSPVRMSIRVCSDAPLTAGGHWGPQHRHGRRRGDLFEHIPRRSRPKRAGYGQPVGSDEVPEQRPHVERRAAVKDERVDGALVRPPEHVERREGVEGKAVDSDARRGVLLGRADVPHHGDHIVRVPLADVPRHRVGAALAVMSRHDYW
jgi:hypothetical protein